MPSRSPEPLADCNVAGLERASRVIFFLDMVESARLIEADEDTVVRRWIALQNRLEAEVFPGYGGRVVKTLGDGVLAEFTAPEPAIAAAFAIQTLSRQLNEGAAAGTEIRLRMGLDAGEVMVTGGDVYGRRVNVAARLTKLAGPGEILASGAVRDLLASELDAEFEDLGECYLRNLAQPVRTYRALPPGSHPRLWPIENGLLPLPTVAVVPFLPYTAGVDHFALGEMLAEDIIVALARSPDMNVISRLSTTAFRMRKTSLDRIAEVLGADFVLSGAYRSHGPKVILDTELAEVRSGTVLWAQRLTDSVPWILGEDHSLADQIVAQVRRAILRRETLRAQSRSMPSLESYTLLLGAIELMHRLSPRDFETARRLLDTLIERTPNHPIPQAWMAKWHVLHVQQGWSDDLARDTYLAQQCTRTALDADPTNALALVMDGFVHTNLLRKLDIAEQRYDSALENSPNDPLGRLLRGTLHAFRGQGTDAVRDTEHARLLTPLDPHRFFYDSLAASACIAAEDYQRAVDLAQQSLRGNRTHTSTLRVMAVAQMRLGLGGEARRTAQALLALEPGLTVQGWLQRSPSADYPVGQAFARTLREIGIPD